MRHLILCQGKAQAEMRRHAGTGLRRTAPEADALAGHDSDHPHSCWALLAPERPFTKSFTPELSFFFFVAALLLSCFCFLLPRRHCLSSCGMCALGENRAIRHCQEMCCTQQVSSHLPLLLQRGLQILKRCITCTLQTAIHHRRAVPQTPRHNPASCSGCAPQRGTSHPAPGYLAMRDESKDTKSKARGYGVWFLLQK